MSHATTPGAPGVRYTDEHEFEPSHGLPERLPAGEALLWQGSPSWKVVALDALHLRLVGGYFALMLGWRGATLVADGASFKATATSLAVLGGLAALALATLGLIAWLIGRTTVYTVTDRRVVLRIGVVLSVTFNLPYSRIDSADLHLHRDGSGDISLGLRGPDRIGLIHLWPHARPWQFKRTQPMLRAVPDAARLAGLMAESLRAEALKASAGAALPEARIDHAAPAANTGAGHVAVPSRRGSTALAA